MTNKRKGRRGVAMESAILTLLMVFGLCLLLTNIAMHTVGIEKTKYRAGDRRAAADAIGERYLAALRGAGDGYAAFLTEGGEGEVAFEEANACLVSAGAKGENDDPYAITIRDADGFLLLLEVKTADEGATWQVLRWSYTQERQ